MQPELKIQRISTTFGIRSFLQLHTTANLQTTRSKFRWPNEKETFLTRKCWPTTKSPINAVRACLKKLSDHINLIEMLSIASLTAPSHITGNQQCVWQAQNMNDIIVSLVIWTIRKRRLKEQDDRVDKQHTSLAQTKI